MSRLGKLNYYFLQWLFLRLYKKVDTETEEIIAWGLSWPVIPLSGYENSWSQKYRYVFRELRLELRKPNK